MMFITIFVISTVVGVFGGVLAALWHNRSRRKPIRPRWTVADRFTFTHFRKS